MQTFCYDAPDVGQREQSKHRTGRDDIRFHGIFLSMGTRSELQFFPDVVRCSQDKPIEEAILELVYADIAATAGAANASEEIRFIRRNVAAGKMGGQRDARLSKAASPAARFPGRIGFDGRP